MPSLIKQMEIQTVQNKIPLNNIASDVKPENKYKKFVPYAILTPAFTAAGAYLGYDSFEKEKKSLKKALDTKVDTDIYNFRNKILSNFSDLVLRIKEGRPTEMPNCLMIKGQDQKYSEKMINWIGQNSKADFITIKVGDDILEHIEKAEENFQKTKNWTLMYIKDMEKLIDHSQVEDRIVEGMKDIMSAASEDYHTTIIFSSSNPEKLDKIALQPHRVKKIVTDKVISPDELYVEDAKSRVKDIKNAQKTPMSTINDLLTISGAPKDVKLVWEHTPEQVKDAEALITGSLDKEKDSEYIKIFNEAVTHLV